MKIINFNSLALTAILVLMTHTTYAQSTLVTIAEDSFATNSSLSNTEVFDFNDLPYGLNSTYHGMESVPLTAYLLETLMFTEVPMMKILVKPPNFHGKVVVGLQ